jgi:flagellar hook-basal body complex protein FliE
MSQRVDISSLLAEMRNIKAHSQAFGGIRPVGSETQISGEIARPNGPRFGDVFSQAINKVNEVQQTSSHAATAYLRGDAGVDITDVMIASQKATVAFQAATQVRNKIVDAYKDIMNMPI